MDMKHCCKNCHFLAKVHIWRDGSERRFCWSQEERSKFRPKHDELSAECAEGVWSTRIDPHLNQRLKEILQKDRKGECYFLEIQEGMSFPAASELQKLRNENLHQRRLYQFTIIGLCIAGVGVLATAVIWIIEKSGWIPR